MTDTRTMRPRRRGKRHATPADRPDRTMCGRSSAGYALDDADPDCESCLAAIDRAIAEDP